MVRVWVENDVYFLLCERVVWLDRYLCVFIDLEFDPYFVDVEV